MIKIVLETLRKNNFNLIHLDGDPNDEMPNLSYYGDVYSFIEIMKKNKIKNIFFKYSMFEDETVDGLIHVQTDNKDGIHEGKCNKLLLFCRIDGYELSKLVTPWSWFDDVVKMFIEVHSLELGGITGFIAESK